tara:strand:- start:5413 stop:6036 length:624 start_codon:yes stop_codon:yes gene_type:complete
MSILLGLCICVNPSNNKNPKKRNQQYLQGLNKFFEYNDILKDNNVDIFITDNTVSEYTNLPNEILNAIPDNCKIITCLNNNYGSINKGAGLIEQWLYNKKLIEQYDWFIHFEPRQLLKSNQFIESFLKEPRNLFTMNVNTYHFNTGLFCISKENLLNYINNCNLKKMVNNRICIEDDLYKYFKEKNLHYDTLEKMDLFWFSDKVYEW